MIHAVQDRVRGSCVHPPILSPAFPHAVRIIMQLAPPTLSGRSRVYRVPPPPSSDVYSLHPSYPDSLGFNPYPHATFETNPSAPRF